MVVDFSRCSNGFFSNASWDGLPWALNVSTVCIRGRPSCIINIQGDDEIFPKANGVSTFLTLLITQLLDPFVLCISLTYTHMQSLLTSSFLVLIPSLSPFQVFTLAK